MSIGLANLFSLILFLALDIMQPQAFSGFGFPFVDFVWVIQCRSIIE